MTTKTVNMNLNDSNATVPEVSAEDAKRNPGLDGKRIQATNDDQVYFVWQGGYKCSIPDPATYNNLFASADGIISLDPDQINKIKNGSPLTSGAIMAQATGDPAIYLVTNGKKNHVASPDVMTYCNFKYPETTYPPILVDSLKDGFTITYDGK